MKSIASSAQFYRSWNANLFNQLVIVLARLGGSYDVRTTYLNRARIASRRPADGLLRIGCRPTLPKTGAKICKDQTKNPPAAGGCGGVCQNTNCLKSFGAVQALFGVLRGGELPRHGFWLCAGLGSTCVVGVALRHNAGLSGAAMALWPLLAVSGQPLRPVRGLLPPFL